MSEPDNFLTRWSRRKRLADEAPDKPASSLPVQAPDAAPETRAQSGEPQNKPGDKPASARAPAANAAPEPAFDPASLPSLDSIGAQTDISAFLKPGVPNDLKLAALRRAWSADPAIRDFRGLAENDWDFTVPNSAMGFGEIDPSIDVKKMLADLFGETPRANESPAELPSSAEQIAPPSDELSSPADRAALHSIAQPSRDSETAAPQQVAATESKMLHREKNTAVQNDDAEHVDAKVPRRRSQGGALPQ
ncbi:MAG: DUF3306 domain-containing protein [Deltaproteobacteria bacterium]|nr:DUF3306 domain-containing protein [Deltaproteobacteria bacterium]